MFAASLAPLGLLHQPAALRTVANARARPAVDLLNELWTSDALPAISALPPGFESLMDLRCRTAPFAFFITPVLKPLP